MKSTEALVREHLQKAIDKAERAEEQVEMWRGLLKIAEKEQQKLT